MVKIITQKVNVNKFLMILAIVAIPLLFSDLFVEKFFFIKNSFLLTINFILILKLANSLTKKARLSFSLDKLSLSLIVLSVILLISPALSSGNLAGAFLYPGRSLELVNLVVYYLFLRTVRGRKEPFIKALALTAIIISLSPFLFQSVYFAEIGLFPKFARGVSFNPTGSNLESAIFLTSLLPIFYYFTKNQKKKIFWISTTLVLIFSVVGSLFFLSKSDPQAHSLESSWSIFVSTMKDKPFFGIGAGNYEVAYTKYVTSDPNSPSNDTIFGAAGNYPLTLATETGLVGVIALVFVLYELFLTIKANAKRDERTKAISQSLIVLTIFMLLLPTGSTSLFVFFTLLAFINSHESTRGEGFTFNLFSDSKRQNAKRTVSIFIPAILISMTVAAIYYSGKALAAEHNHSLALERLEDADPKKAYKLSQKSVILNSQVDRYHLTYGQINLFIGKAIAEDPQRNIENEKENEELAKFLQQAIREAKNAVEVNPQKSANWQFLGKVYEEISPLAEDAMGFSIQSYSQAILLHPSSVALRIKLGDLYLTSGGLEKSIQSYHIATILEPESAYAHTKLSSAYKENGQIESAISEMQQVLTLLENSSKDYEIAREKLEELKKERDLSENAPTGEQIIIDRPTETEEAEITN